MNELDSAGGELTAAEASGKKRESGTIWEELNTWGQSLAEWQRYIVSYGVRDVVCVLMRGARLISLKSRGLSLLQQNTAFV